MDYPWPGSRFPPQDPTSWTQLPFSAPEYPAILSIPTDSQQWIPTAYEQDEHVTTSTVHVVPHPSGFLNGQMVLTLPPSPHANGTVAQSHHLQLSDNTSACNVQSMAPPSNPRKRKAPTLRQEDWEPVKARIVELHITQNMPLPQVKQIVEEDFKSIGFNATIRQYRTRISHWNLDKSIKSKEMKPIVQKRQYRRLVETNKGELMFRIRGNVVDPEKIDRWMKRNQISEDMVYALSPAACTPGAISAWTASERGSPAPSPAHLTMSQIILNDESNEGGSKSLEASPGAINCYTPSETGPVTPRAAPCPLAPLSPQLSISHHGLHTSSYQFGDPGPILPSSPWVAQIADGSHMQHSSPIPIAASPTASSSALLELEESTFTGQSPAPFSVPSTPQAYNHDLLQDEAMEVTCHGDNAHTLASAWSLACVLERQGKYSMAERMHRLALQLKEKVLGHEHPDTLASMGKLAHVLGSQGRYRAAEQMERQTLQLNQKVLGANHPDTLTSMDRLTLVLERQGRYTAAEQLGRQALELREKVLGSEHPDTLTSMRTLAVVLVRLGRHIAAERIARQSLELRQKILGPEHHDTLMSMNSLAVALERQSKYVEAEEMKRQTLELRQKILGPEHPETLASMNNLAVALGRQGKYVEAEEMDRQTLELRQNILGPEHPDTLMSMNNLAVALDSQGKYVEAEEMDRQTLELRQKILGPEHPDTLMSMNRLAVALGRQGKYVEAEEMDRQTLELSQKILGPEHPDTLMSMNNLAATLRRQGKYVEAAQIFSYR